MNPIVWVPVAVLGVLVLFVVIQYNKLVSMRWRIKESWSNVDTELKRRTDLIPNLVSTVKGYAAHEKSLFENVARLRTQAQQQTSDSAERRGIERELSGALANVLAVAENYPQLRANENFMQLQRELVVTEDRIQASRRFFNGNVRDYNNQVKQFPSNVVANAFKFGSHDYFELPSAADRFTPVTNLA